MRQSQNRSLKLKLNATELRIETRMMNRDYECFLGSSELKPNDTVRVHPKKNLS